MATYKAKLRASYGWVGTDTEEEIEFDMPDDATPDQIQAEADQIAWEWACERVYSYSEKPVKQQGNATEGDKKA